jgi:hypothetical protein
VGDLLRPMPQHGWGALSLERMPRSLNVANSPDVGNAALEQRGPPVGAGQRSLEFND